jgi:hypothetical protein
LVSVGVIRTTWAGLSGGPGLTQLFFQDATGAQISSSQATTCTGAVRLFWDAMKAHLPDDLVLTVQPGVDIYEIASGELIAAVTATTSPPAVAGTATGGYAAAAGMKVNLVTNVIATGRRVRGAIYAVPAAASVYTASGQIGSTQRTAIDSAGNTLLTSFASAGCNLVVYSRKKLKDGLEVNGHTSVVAKLETNEKTAVLRGRRD